jgi:hypothetical protein
MYVIKPFMATGTNAVYIKLGFCPEFLEVVDATAKIMAQWHRALGANSMLISTPDETDDSGDVTALTSDYGVYLVNFEGKDPTDLDSAPSVVTDPSKADGIKIMGDFGSGSTSMSDGDVCWVRAWRPSNAFVRAVHDGGAVTYLKDSSQDFRELGVAGGQLWIAINITQTSYAYVGDVQKPFGADRYNKCTLTDAAGNDITSNMSDDDVVWLIPAADIQYPLSDIGAFS